MVRRWFTGVFGRHQDDGFTEDIARIAPHNIKFQGWIFDGYAPRERGDLLEGIWVLLFVKGIFVLHEGYATNGHPVWVRRGGSGRRKVRIQTTNRTLETLGYPIDCCEDRQGRLLPLFLDVPSHIKEVAERTDAITWEGIGCAFCSSRRGEIRNGSRLYCKECMETYPEAIKRKN